jgi:hypothetical protein
VIRGVPRTLAALGMVVALVVGPIMDGQQDEDAARVGLSAAGFE